MNSRSLTKACAFYYTQPQRLLSVTQRTSSQFSGELFQWVPIDYIARSLAADEGDLSDFCLNFSPVHCMSLAVYRHTMAHPGMFSSKPCAFLCSTVSQCLENGMQKWSQRGPLGVSLPILQPSKQNCLYVGIAFLEFAHLPVFPNALLFNSLTTFAMRLD